MQKLYHQLLTFDGFTLDLSRSCLLRGEEQVKLRPKSFDVLRHLSENSGRLVSKAELMEVVWPDSFVTDDSLVQCLLEIRRALGDDSHRYIKTIPRRGYIFEAEVAEHGPAGGELIFTEELERVGVVIEEEVEEETKVTTDIALTAPQAASTQRRLSGITPHKPALLALVLAVLTLGGLGAYLLTSRGESIDSVAVIPFVNVGGDPEMEYLTDGLTESVIGNLTRLSTLKVMSRNSVFRYKGKEVDPQAVARELNVQAVLIGRLESRGDNFVISLELVDARDNRQLWGSQYNRRLADLPTLQAHVSREISERLRPRQSAEGQQRQLTSRHTEDAEAYRLYLKGRFHWNKLTEEGARKAIDYFNQAVRKDPGYARAYAALTESYILLGVDHLRPKEAFPVAKVYALKASELDVTLPEVHAAMGAINFFYEWDWSAADTELKRIIELNPESAEPYACTLHYLDAMGQPNEAVAQIKRVAELHPTSLVINGEIGCASYYAHRYDRAIAELRETLEMDPHYVYAHYNLGRAYGQKGLYEESVAALTRARSLSENSLFIAADLGYSYAAWGKKGEAQKVLRELEDEAARRYVDPYLMAIIHAGLGEKDQAFVWLNKAFEERSTWMPWLKVEPKFDGLRSDRRFQDLMRRVGLTP